MTRRVVGRVIKFRAWDQVERVMHPHVQDWYDTLTEKRGEPEQTEQSFGNLLEKPERYVVMQWTGLLDRHGREIYEGDVLKDFGEVVWGGALIDAWNAPQHPAGFVLRETVGQTNALFDWINPGKLEILGNIYEHPNLLAHPEPRRDG